MHHTKIKFGGGRGSNRSETFLKGRKRRGSILLLIVRNTGKMCVFTEMQKERTASAMQGQREKKKVPLSRMQARRSEDRRIFSCLSTGREKKNRGY